MGFKTVLLFSATASSLSIGAAIAQTLVADNQIDDQAITQQVIENTTNNSFSAVLNPNDLSLELDQVEGGADEGDQALEDGETLVEDNEVELIGHAETEYFERFKLEEHKDLQEGKAEIQKFLESDQNIDVLSEEENAILTEFYESRSFVPFFKTNQSANESLNRAIPNAPNHGLPLERYELNEEGLEFAQAELMAAASFMRYASDLETGLVAPKKISEEFDIEPAKRSTAQLMNAFERASDKQKFFQDIAPNDPAYAVLQSELQKIRSLMGADIVNPVEIPSGEALSIGSNGPRVIALRERLTQLGFDAIGEPEDIKALRESNAVSQADIDVILRDISNIDKPTVAIVTSEENTPVKIVDKIDAFVAEIFDERLDEIVKTYQERAGLYVDGVVGSGTISSLNRGPEDHLRSVLVALERLRWTGDQPEGREIFVNIANYTTQVREGGNKIFETRVVVGKNKETHRTPEFEGEMTYLVINPRWHVPESISVREYLPRMRRDPGVLARNNMTMRRKGSGKVVSPYDVNLTDLSEDNFPYLLRQDSGRGNALGNVKFMFPNGHNIYLHDTPSRGLFKRSERAFSHGCVRVGDPEDLATLLLSAQTQSPRETYRGYLNIKGEQRVDLEVPVPVRITYLTAYLNDEGGISYAGDPYGRDAMIAKAMEEKGVTF